MWPAMACEFSSGAAKAELRSGECVSTMAMILFGSQRRYWSPMRSPGFTMRNRLAVRRQARAVIDVVHALEGRVLPGIDLQDDLVGLIEPGLVVADRRGRDQPAVFAGCRPLRPRATSSLPRKPNQTNCATCERWMSI